MPSDLESKAYGIVDTLLIILKDNPKGTPYYAEGLGSAGFLAKEIIDRYKLVNYQRSNNAQSFVSIGAEGFKVLELGGIEEYIALRQNKEKEKESLEIQLLRSDLQKTRLEIDNLVNTVSDYDKTKSIASRGFTISVITVILLILTTVREFMCNKPG